MGWAEGLNAGINLGNVIKQGMLQQDLADEAKKYKVTEGAYGDMSSNIEQVRALQAQNPEQAAQYEPAIAELQRRQGLTAPDYSVASGGYDGGKNYASMKEAQQASAPLRTQGLSDVYRSYGQIDKAEELTSRAQQQQLTGLQLNKAMREDEDAVRMQAFEKDYSTLENPSDMAAVKSLAAKHQLNRGQQFSVASQISGIDKAELEVLDTYVKKAVKGKDLDGLLTLHKDDKNFADGTHFVKAVGANGQVILNLVSDADPTKVLRTESFKSPDLATAYLRKQAEDPGNVAEWALGIRAKEASISKDEASAGKDRTLQNLYGAGLTTGGPKTGAAKMADFKATMGRDPTDAEKLTLLGVTGKSGTRGLQMPVTLQKNDDDTQTAFSKETGEPVYNVYRGQKLPIGTSVADFQRMTTMAKDNNVQLALGENDAGGLELRYIGADGKGYTDPEKAKYAKPTEAAGKGGKGGIDTSGKGDATGTAEKKFIRKQNPRGGYTYTESPRGLTRAQYAEIDNK